MPSVPADISIIRNNVCNTLYILHSVIFITVRPTVFGRWPSSLLGVDVAKPSSCAWRCLVCEAQEDLSPPGLLLPTWSLCMSDRWFDPVYGRSRSTKRRQSTWCYAELNLEPKDCAWVRTPGTWWRVSAHSPVEGLICLAANRVFFALPPDESQNHSDCLTTQSWLRQLEINSNTVSNYSSRFTEGLDWTSTNSTINTVSRMQETSPGDDKLLPYHRTCQGRSFHQIVLAGSKSQKGEADEIPSLSNPGNEILARYSLPSQILCSPSRTVPRLNTSAR